jgi:putative hydrolase of the HAD superfamily
MAAIRDALAVSGLAPTDEELFAAWRSGFTAYLEAWQAGRHFGAFEQVAHALRRFGVAPLDGIVARTARHIEESGANANLQLQPGAAEVIPALTGAGVKLGLISDTGLTPGRILRGFLERDGLLAHFSSLTFSDETGFPKPDPRMFYRTLAPLGVVPAEAAHVGDTPRTDIAGAQAVGMCAIRFAAAHDTAEPPAADSVIYDHRDLLPLAGLKR